METYLAIAALLIAALVLTSTASYRLRRARWAVALVAGGWPMVAIGAAVGPGGLGLIGAEPLLRLTPIAAVGLGWIGMLVGMQLRRDVLRALPTTILRLSAVDAGVSVLTFGAIAALVLIFWTGTDEVAALWPAIVLVAAGSIGWSMETRSAGPPSTPPAERVALAIRAGGGLGAAAAVALFGIGTLAVSAPTPGTPAAFDMGRLAGGLVIVAALGVAVGVIARFALTLAGKSAAQQLAVFLGLVAFVAGVAEQLRVPPLFAALAAGAVVANLAGPQLRQFERFILKAEHPVAAIFALLAGVLLDPVIGLAGLALAAAVAVARSMVKPTVARTMLERELPAGEGGNGSGSGASGGAGQAGGGSGGAAGRLLAGAARQTPVMLAMAVSLVLAEPSAFSKRLLAVVALAGLLAEVWPAVQGLKSRGGGSDAAARARRDDDASHAQAAEREESR